VKRKEYVMWRWFLTFLLVASLGIVGIGCPREAPVVPPPDDPAPEEPASPPAYEEPASPPHHEHHDHEHPEEPGSPPGEPGSP
jgi:hypothetical protein